MSFLYRLPGIALTLALAAAVGAGAWWLITHKPAASKSDKPPGAATVDKVVKEEDLARVIVSAKAVERLGLTVAPVVAKSVRRVRVYGGEVTIPVGRTILVAAPLGGTLKPPPGGLPKAGQVVRVGDPVFLLLPLLTPDSKATLSAALADADGQVNTAKASYELAVIAAERAVKVLRGGAGSQRQVDEARAALDVAKKTLDAAAARRGVLTKVVGDSDGGTAAPIPIDAPENGILRTVSALAGQTVPPGAALFEVVDLSTVWIRVPLPVGDLDGLAEGQPALVGRLTAVPGHTLTPATPVPAPPSANLLSGTVDHYYTMPNPGAALTPGQRVGVTLPLDSPAESVVLPWSAVVFDIHGNTWIFEESAPRTYYRRRVTVAYSDPADLTVAVLRDGPTAGTRVVTHGVQELFGAETGFIK